MTSQTTTTALTRKKLWEIDPQYLCATIGSCLSRQELRQLAKMKVFSLTALTDDYKLHSLFIDIAGRGDAKGKALQRYLDKKYRQVTRPYFLTDLKESIEELWNQDLTSGRLDKAWWALVTHPAILPEMLSHYYGQLHILAHEAIALHHQRTLLQAEQRQHRESLEETLRSLKKDRIAERKAIAREREQNKHNLAILSRLESENRDLRVRISQQTSSHVAKSRAIGGDSSHAEQQIETKLKQDIDFLKKTHEASCKRISDLEKHQLALLQQRDEWEKELASMESLLQQRLIALDPCRVCDQQQTDTCPGKSLCGRTVLYVGGLNSLIPYYRQLVETLGGRFLHHDGGKESSRNILPKLLSSADAVFCPTDCISHDACHCVKKICRRYQKPFVMMRSASLAALAKGLSAIDQ